ncbi:hypothetical protein SDC9_21759 [bioreactor metagenome]|uniref:Cupin type-2 domain-containing protein n=1 Tax=bioreactor metagenome TaxID=1076179 RepID=A0A644UAB6_9ZZZZ|nr:cupin domain-containing protein [Candidatus Elulimicrobiales bacterium]
MSYITNIEKDTLENSNFRKVLFTAKHMQLVVMSIPVGGDIGMETHGDVDQFIRVEKGKAKSILNGVETELEDDFSVIVPAGTEHNIVNIGDEDLKVYTIYARPEHKKGTIHTTKEDAMANEEHFDGATDVE